MYTKGLLLPFAAAQKFNQATNSFVPPSPHHKGFSKIESRGNMQLARQVTKVLKSIEKNKQEHLRIKEWTSLNEVLRNNEIKQLRKKVMCVYQKIQSFNIKLVMNISILIYTRNILLCKFYSKSLHMISQWLIFYVAPWNYCRSILYPAINVLLHMINLKAGIHDLVNHQYSMMEFSLYKMIKCSFIIMDHPYAQFLGY